ncbi:mechanosensitive ion channel protein 6-like [Tripterygium wilfordii]|uniref:Mechanosensitive ion channel protein n=1 Tax=Tripterygium wilfordii TaxID=458696 RepID=A0A7J7BZM0_TRIWF|nr:mechanosensitive ion channel protein 6-like [Tripterygium wilfordii]KAF5727125.1 mechanosensitive ion channel protein 6-like [Tripterygium wilfordii]
MEFSLKKSFNTLGSYKHSRRISAGGATSESSSHEELPILLHHNAEQQQLDLEPMSTRREVIVKVDGGDRGSITSSGSRESNDSLVTTGKMWRESSLNYWGEGEENQQMNGQDPPTKLIGEFLNKQRNAGGEVTLDMDLEMEEIRDDRCVPQPAAEFLSGNTPPKELRVSFDPSSVSSVSNSSVYKGKQNKDEVVRCTSFEKHPSMIQRGSGLLSRLKTKSRFEDPPPEEVERRSGRLIGKSGPLRSGMTGKATEEEEDDPWSGEDLPEEYRKQNLNALTIMQWVSLVSIIGALICNLLIQPLKEKSVWGLKLWKWEVMVLVLICGRLVSGWGIRIIVFCIERNFLLRKRVLYFVYGLRKAVQNCLWLALVLIAWHFLFDKKVEREKKTKTLKYVTRVLVCFLIGTLLWLLKTLMVKVLASSFHVSTYFDRIQESLFNQFVIETLLGPPLIEIGWKEEAERTSAEIRKLQNAGAIIPPELKSYAFASTKSGKVIGKSFKLKSDRFSQQLSKKEDEGITIDHLDKLNTKNVSAWNMKRLIRMVRHGALTTLGEQILDASQGDDESAVQIRSEYEAKIAARKIFNNVAQRGSKYIYLVDLMRFLGEDEARKSMSLFEGALESKRISKSSLKNWVVNAFRERRALALTLNDTKTAVNKLHRMVNIIVGIIIIVIWLVILGIATREFLLFVSSQLVLVAFIFGNTCKTIFEAIIFVFVMHPFDVGDRCEVDGVQMVVEEMNILTTVFLRYDNLKIIYPNSTLSTKLISNFYRSPDMGDAVEFCVHISTPAEKIAVMKQRIVSYIENKKEHWYPSPTVVLKDVEDFTRLRFAVWPSHRMNHQTMGERWARRALLVEEMVKVFRELDIQYRLFPLDINIRSMTPATTSSPATPLTGL